MHSENVKQNAEGGKKVRIQGNKSFKKRENESEMRQSVFSHQQAFKGRR